MCKNKGIYCYNDHENGSGYCTYCEKNGYAGAKPVKEPYKIPRESKKRAKENRIDQKQNRKIRTDNIYCQMRLTGCTRFAQGVQHLKGRTGELLTDLSNKIPACNNCNRRAETHPEEARAKGVAKYKHRIN